MIDRGIEVRCHKCGAEAGSACRTPKGSIHKHGTHDGRGRQTTDDTVHYYTPTQVRNMLHDAVKAERERCGACADDFAAMMENGAGECEPGQRFRQLGRKIRAGDPPLGTAKYYPNPDAASLLPDGGPR